MPPIRGPPIRGPPICGPPICGPQAGRVRRAANAHPPHGGHEGEKSSRQPERHSPAGAVHKPAAHRPRHQVTQHKTRAEQGGDPSPAAGIEPGRERFHDRPPAHGLHPAVDAPQSHHGPRIAARAHGRVAERRGQHSRTHEPAGVHSLGQRPVDQLAERIDPQKRTADPPHGARVPPQVGPDGRQSDGDVDPAQVKAGIAQPGDDKDALLPAPERAISRRSIQGRSSYERGAGSSRAW
jgi:hypothetical protein